MKMNDDPNSQRNRELRRRKMIYQAISRERTFQERKWGTNAEHPHDVGAWLTIMRVELVEAERDWCTANGHKKALTEILQVAAVAVACMEQHGVVERGERDDT